VQVLVNKEVGFWLARILYTHNPAKSDSAKIPGMMELLRVQVSGAVLLVIFVVACVACGARSWKFRKHASYTAPCVLACSTVVALLFSFCVHSSVPTTN
jgi:hypothetical protein